jgi:hypothetical protein
MHCAWKDFVQGRERPSRSYFGSTEVEFLLRTGCFPSLQFLERRAFAIAGEWSFFRIVVIGLWQLLSGIRAGEPSKTVVIANDEWEQDHLPPAQRDTILIECPW